jgi:nitroreductase
MSTHTMGTVHTAMRSELAIHPLLGERYSPRAFSDRDVTEEELVLLMEAARWAPSSRNEQPWRFLVTRRGGEGHHGLLDSLNPGNARWAEHAPVLVLVLANALFQRDGSPNLHAWHDTGLAVSQLTVQAMALGMGVRQLAGFDADKARSAFGIPSEFDAVSVLAIGYPGDPHTLPEDLREREMQRSPRKPLGEIVHRGAFRP